MPFRRTHAHRAHRGTTSVVRTSKPTLMDRLRGRPAHATVTTTTAARPARRSHYHRRHHQTAVAPVAPVQQRRPTLGDKVSGVLMRLRGTLTRRPGLKAAGRRREHGTDGRGMRRTRY